VSVVPKPQSHDHNSGCGRDSTVATRPRAQGDAGNRDDTDADDDAPLVAKRPAQAEAFIGMLVNNTCPQSSPNGALNILDSRLLDAPMFRAGPIQKPRSRFASARNIGIKFVDVLTWANIELGFGFKNMFHHQRPEHRFAERVTLAKHIQLQVHLRLADSGWGMMW
jgi:hypothetical protein